MERKSEMVKEYDTEQDFHVDEQKLSREGWTVEPTANQGEAPGFVDRIRALFSRGSAPSRIVVTYTRQRPT